MDGRRTALIIANDEYEHPGLSRLRAPAADAQALANVLSDKEIGGFRVQTVHNAPAHIVEGHIEDLFADSQSDDLVLLHFSGHGLKSDSGELFLATRNTRPDRLGSTAVPADFIQRCMRTSRARSIVLFLDCCYGGAFGEGVAVRGSGSANVLENFAAGRLGGGRGRAVITASSAMEYAFEGNSLADEHQQQPSVFTAALVEGLTTGEADRDEDGLVSLNELYDYVFDHVRERNPKQTPGRDVELQGELYLARSKRRRLRALPIPGDVAGALKDDNVFTRLGAVAELRARMTSADLGAALGAYEALVDVARSDIRYVQDAAAEALAGAALSPVPGELDFGTVPQGVSSVVQTIRLGGPPLAGAVTVSQSEVWVTARTEPSAVLVSIDTSQKGSLSGTVTLTGPTGQVVIPVTAQVVNVSPAPSETPLPASAETPAEPPAGRLPRRPLRRPLRRLLRRLPRRPLRDARRDQDPSRAGTRHTRCRHTAVTSALEVQRHRRPRLGRAHAAVHRVAAAVREQHPRQGPPQGGVPAVSRRGRPVLGKSHADGPMADPGAGRCHRSGGREHRRRLRHGEHPRQNWLLGVGPGLLGRFRRPPGPSRSGRSGCGGSPTRDGCGFRRPPWL